MSDTEQQRPLPQRAMSLLQFCARYGPGRTKAYEELKSGRLRGRKVGKRTIIAELAGVHFHPGATDFGSRHRRWHGDYAQRLLCEDAVMVDPACRQPY
jgi:hypothetical protein